MLRCFQSFLANVFFFFFLMCVKKNLSPCKRSLSALRLGHCVNVAGGFSVNVGVSLHGLRFLLKEFVLKFIREEEEKNKQLSWRNRCLFSVRPRCLMAILQPSDSCAADFSPLSLVIAVLAALCPALPAALGDYVAFCRGKN